MTNREIAGKFNLLGKLMELHDENAFKIRTYSNAYISLGKQAIELSTATEEELKNIHGVGKAILLKVQELNATGEIQELESYLEKTPDGIVDLLGIKGVGPKKVKAMWKELGIESPGELLYAINENRLVDLKGFGAKTQASMKDQIQYYLDSTDKQLFASVIDDADKLMLALKKQFPKEMFSLTGEIYRKKNIIQQIEILHTEPLESIIDFCKKSELIDDHQAISNCKVIWISSNVNDFFLDLVKTSCDKNFLTTLNLEDKLYQTEKDVFEANELPFYIPEYREDANIQYIKRYSGESQIVCLNDIKGCIHNHSTYSDGIHTIEEMLSASLDKEHEYFVLTDHSKSAFYANGLSVERLYKQLDEIKDIDQKYEDIKLFSGIESDILSNGDLDYDDEVLGDLDLIIASVHSNLKMDIDKATRRLLEAIRNPFTSILGHPTGRLLLSRKGYPIDYKMIIDACAENNVAIEINANPLRLDMDWTWINYGIENDVIFSINPDAHSIKGIEDIKFGVWSARKAGLPKSHCLNAFDLDEFEEWLSEQHQKRAF